LYVEDNAANLTLIRKVLESTGKYVIHGAPTAEEGLERLASIQPHLILSDLDLPGADGFAFARTVRGDPAYAHGPLVAISANVMKDEHELALASGFSAFVEKPFDIQHLRQLVAQLLSAA
jgi:CheY-like chemotaxis protein